MHIRWHWPQGGVRPVYRAANSLDPTIPRLKRFLAVDAASGAEPGPDGSPAADVPGHNSQSPDETQAPPK